MSDTNALMAVAQEGMAMQKYDDKDFGLVASTGDWLPYLMLGTSNAELVKSAKLGLTHYATVKGDDFVDHGKSLDCWALAWRPKAMDMNPDVPLSFFDPKSEIFQKIKNESFEQNSRKMYGPEYLIFIPNFGWCTLFMGSKTARNEAKNIQAALPNPTEKTPAQPLVLTSKYIQTESFSWHGIVAAISSKELAVPDVGEYKEQLQKFLNPKDSTIQVAAPAGAKTEDRG